MRKTKSELKTEQMVRRLKKAFKELEEARQKIYKSTAIKNDKKSIERAHRKIDVSNVKYGKKKFSSYQSARKYLKEKEKQIENRRLKIKESKRRKKAVESEKKALQRISKTKKGKELVKKYRELKRKTSSKVTIPRTTSQKQLRRETERLENNIYGRIYDIYSTITVAFSTSRTGNRFAWLYIREEIYKILKSGVMSVEDREEIENALLEQYKAKDEDDEGLTILYGVLQRIVLKYNKGYKEIEPSFEE